FSDGGQPSFYVGITSGKTPYNPTNLMPQPNTNGAPSAQSATGAPFLPAVLPSVGEKDIDPSDASFLTTGATGLPTPVLDRGVPAPRVRGRASLPPGPFVLQGQNINDDDYTGDMTPRFYQDWQQEDCSAANASKGNNSGCLNDLFAFVMATYSATNKSAGNE